MFASSLGSVKLNSRLARQRREAERIHSYRTLSWTPFSSHFLSLLHLCRHTREEKTTGKVASGGVGREEEEEEEALLVRGEENEFSDLALEGTSKEWRVEAGQLDIGSAQAATAPKLARLIKP